ncbi:hypothetical protein Taro_005114 [Colocasia esculenta]|uniref:Small ribosomal subunit protein uS17c n=1 Tax=Colocasia esculenta TaxID=4460 RepID=A0A843TTK7_COLES|nr:hypothetical protein [Colocasia esculenta]
MPGCYPFAATKSNNEKRQGGRRQGLSSQSPISLSPVPNSSSAMFLTSSLLQLPTAAKPHPSPFLHGPLSCPSPFAPSTKPSSPPPCPSTSLPLTVRAMRTMQGRVVCATSDKTVAVEVTRLAPHPKYKRRVRKKKTFQAHDPDNQFKVGDIVQLEKSRPISKNKTFLAIPVAARESRRPAETASEDLGLPLESQMQ